MKILLIDAMNCLHRAWHSYSKLQNSGQPVSIIFGMPSIVNGLINKFHPDKLLVIWDGKKSSHRLELLPEYKAHRKTRTTQEHEDFVRQKTTTMELFHSLGVKQVINIDQEADDMIYYFVRKYKKDKANKITIVSTDKDFHQLLCSNVKIWNTHKEAFVHSENCEKLMGYTPQQCVSYLTLRGDDSDNIPGYRGIGEVKAKQFLEKFGTVKGYLSQGDEFKGIDRKTLAILWYKNQPMIDLRYFYGLHLRGKVKPSYYNQDRKPKLNKQKLFRICAQYYIKTFRKHEFLKNYE